MDKLSTQFDMNMNNAVSNPENTFKGEKYRITILSERLVRLEYSETGTFIDNPSMFAINRNFNKVEANVQQNEKIIDITTKYFKLTYNKNRPFSRTTIRALLNNTNSMWYYGHPEVRNYFGTTYSLDDNDGHVKLKKGLYSSDGFVTIDDSSSMIMDETGVFKSRTNKNIDIYLFMYRKDFGLCLSDYFSLTGYPVMLPRYAFGNWWSKEYKYDEKETFKLLDKFKSEEIPLSILLLDKDWHVREIGKHKNANNGYDFNTTLFPKPSALINRVHTDGVMLGLRTNPVEGIYDSAHLTDEMRTSLGFIKKSIIPFNILSMEFIDTYFKSFVYPVEQLGIDFWWVDNRLNNKNIIASSLVNHYHYMDSNKNDKKRGLLLARNASSAPHRYGVLYSGNTVVGWETLKMLPYFNSSSANMGVSYWSHDVGGAEFGIEDPELYLRSVQFGCFSPIFRFHSVRGRYYKREPWRWDPATRGIVKEYMTLRHKLIPYIYNASYNYHKKGMPMIQPIYYKYPELFDDLLYKDEYYIGTEMLVAPITEKVNEVMNRTVKRIFVPDGTWYDFRTGKQFPGGKKYISFYTQEQYPVFCRAGAIIPMATEDNLRTDRLPESMEVHVFPGRSNTYEMYEDDGVSNLYKDDHFIVTAFDYTYQRDNHTLIIRPVKGKKGIIPSKRNYKIRFRNSRQPEEIKVYENANQATYKSYIEDTDFIIEIEDISTLSQMTITCKGKDMSFDALRIMNEEVDGIISDLAISTKIKEMVAEIFFSDTSIRKKRIAVRKLRKKNVEKRFIKLFLKLLEYIDEI